MGLIRKSLFVASGGIVAPNSKKQRNQRQLLAAAQGKSDAEVRRAGGRYEHSLGAVLGWGGDRPAHEQAGAHPQVRPPAGSRIVVGGYGEGWAPDAEYCRMVQLLRESGGDKRMQLHRVPLGPDRAPLACWSCGEAHEKARRGFRYQTTSLRWDRPQDRYLALAEPTVVQAALAAQTDQAEPAQVRSAAERLREVSELHDAGLLTDAEYEAKRAALIEQL